MDCHHDDMLARVRGNQVGEHQAEYRTAEQSEPVFPAHPRACLFGVVEPDSHLRYLFGGEAVRRGYIVLDLFYLSGYRSLLVRGKWRVLEYFFLLTGEESSVSAQFIPQIGNSLIFLSRLGSLLLLFLGRLDFRSPFPCAINNCRLIAF
jgi:hypothetical protein